MNGYEIRHNCDKEGRVFDVRVPSTPLVVCPYCCKYLNAAIDSASRSEPQQITPTTNIQIMPNPRGKLLV